MILKKQFLKKKTVGVKNWSMGRVSCYKDLSNLTYSDQLFCVAYTGESVENANNLTKKKIEIVVEYFFL